ncbi:MAG TPA: GNAT family N-acetyltransferase [Chloroflexia bacterium]|nr:GNAT family N-acetyltransferase [Chloroflexia bacterium]
MLPLETERLVIREMRRSDVETLQRLFGDPLFMRFWPVFDRRRTEQWVEDNLLSYAQRGFGLWALTLRGSDEAIGDCGLGLIHGMEAPDLPAGPAPIQIGWHVRRDLWGQGLATEAARACRDYAFARLELPALHALIQPANTASRRVAEKLGMTLLREVPHRGRLICLYGMRRPPG